MQKIPAFVINLKKDVEKMADVADQFCQLAGIRLFRIDGFVGSDLPDLLCQLLTLNDWSVENKGTLGCFVSHAIAWGAIAKQSEPFALVLEDDAAIQNSDTLIRLDLPADTDIVFCNERTTYPSEANQSCFRPVEPILHYLSRKGSSIGTDGYILTPQGASKLLQYIRKDHMFSHIDLRLMAYCLSTEFSMPEEYCTGTIRNILGLRQTYSKDHKLNAYSLFPFITRHKAEGPTSSRTIEDSIGRSSQRIQEVQLGS